MGSRGDQLRATADLLDQEDAFVADKEAGEATAEQRAEVRSARQALRAERDGLLLVEDESGRVVAVDAPEVEA